MEATDEPLRLPCRLYADVSNVRLRALEYVSVRSWRRIELGWGRYCLRNTEFLFQTIKQILQTAGVNYA